MAIKDLDIKKLGSHYFQISGKKAGSEPVDTLLESIWKEASVAFKDGFKDDLFKIVCGYAKTVHGSDQGQKVVLTDHKTAKVYKELLAPDQNKTLIGEAPGWLGIDRTAFPYDPMSMTPLNLSVPVLCVGRCVFENALTPMRHCHENTVRVKDLILSEWEALRAGEASQSLPLECLPDTLAINSAIPVRPIGEEVKEMPIYGTEEFSEFHVIQYRGSHTLYLVLQWAKSGERSPRGLPIYRLIHDYDPIVSFDRRRW